MRVQFSQTVHGHFRTSVLKLYPYVFPYLTTPNLSQLKAQTHVSIWQLKILGSKEVFFLASANSCLLAYGPFQSLLILSIILSVPVYK